MSARRLLEQSLQPVGETAAERADAWLFATAMRLREIGPAARGGAPGSSPWENRSGFRMNGEPLRRAALRIGDERRWASHPLPG